MNCPKCGERMHPHQLRIRLELPGEDPEEPVALERADALVSVDLMNPTRALPLEGYMCPSLRCGTYVIGPRE